MCCFQILQISVPVVGLAGNGHADAARSDQDCNFLHGFVIFFAKKQKIRKTVISHFADCVSIFSEISLPKIHRIRAQVFLHEACEIRRRGEVELVADFG